MNAWLLVAMSLSLLVGAAHSLLGERYIVSRLLRRTDLPHLFGSDAFTRRVIRLAWHLTSIAWWGAAGLFWALGEGSARAGLHVMSVMFLVSAVVTAAGSRGRHLAWIVFAAIAVAAWLGAPAT